jgi:hypothetical protein
MYKTKDSSSRIIMNLSDGCINDMQSLLYENTIPSISSIVGCNEYGDSINNNKTNRENTLNYQLVARGNAWADHINEPWNILVAVGLYIIISVGFGLPIFGLCGDLILLIVRSAGVNTGFLLLFRFYHDDYDKCQELDILLSHRGVPHICISNQLFSRSLD